jgi:hypothetical protein
LKLQVPTTSVGRATELLRAMPGVVTVSNGEVDRTLDVELSPPDERAGGDGRSTNRILDALVDADIQVLSFEVEGSRLQDAFMMLTEGARS